MYYKNLALVDGGQEGLALREAPVVLEEPLLGLIGLELHTDPHLGPGAVEAHLHEALEDVLMNVLDIRRGSIAVKRGNEDRLRVQLLRLLVEDPVVEDLFHPLGELPEFPEVRGVAGAGGPEVHGHGWRHWRLEANRPRGSARQEDE